jgi:16S rRNA (guanine527-N7)-methyltransferase
VTRWEDVQTTHFLDSLTVRLGMSSDSGRLADVGSGAGFPGVPLKIVFPGLQTTLIESTGKKTAFLHHLAGDLDLEMDVRKGRAETLAHEPDLRESFDFVTSRAVAGMAVLAELCLPFCRVGGTVVAQKKGDIEEEIANAGRAIDAMGGRLKEVKEVSLSGLGEARRLVLLEKVRPTPDKYPRRPGVPAKRPLSCRAT